MPLADHIIAPDDLPYCKAGVVLSGVKTEDIGKPNAQNYVVAPYTEGRFGDNDKFYVLPKGSIDAGESILAAALRETTEETGIDLLKLLGSGAVAALLCGEAVGGFVSPGYAGVRIKSFAPQALDFAYEGREGVTHRTVLFKMELEGIEKLAPHLKNPENKNRSSRIMQVDHPVRSVLHPKDNASCYPTFSDRLQWLRSMKMPAAAWNQNTGGEPLVLRDADGSPISVPDDWFVRLEKNFLQSYPYKCIENADDWQSFLKQLPAADCRLIYQAAGAIRHKLIELNILDDDNSYIKLDTKDLPLFFYQEGADIITMDDWLYSCIKNSARREDFALAFCGNTKLMIDKKASPAMRIVRSQMAGVVWATGDKYIAKIPIHLERDKLRTSGILWGAPVNHYLHNVLVDDLQAIHSQLAASREVPSASVTAIVPRGVVMPSVVALG